jgi:hypothetical protein
MNTMRSIFLSAILGLGVLAFGTATPAEASWLSEFLKGGRFGPSYRQPYGPGVGYGGYANGPGAYYGRGRYDNAPYNAPYRQRDRTPYYGGSEWYGRGSYDNVPYQQYQTPYSYRGQPWPQRGYNESYYPSAPYYSRPRW